MAVKVESVDGKSSICWIRDLVNAAVAVGDIIVDNLLFDWFTMILEEDLEYDSSTHNIVYNCTGQKGMKVWNERTWKAAMEEMYSRGVH
jgi:hypothetical protein